LPDGAGRVSDHVSAAHRRMRERQGFRSGKGRHIRLLCEYRGNGSGEEELSDRRCYDREIHWRYAENYAEGAGFDRL